MPLTSPVRPITTSVLLASSPSRAGPPSFASCWRAREAGLRENQNPAMEMVVNMHGLGAGGLLIEQGDPVMVSVSKRESRLGLALWPELPERAVIHLV